MRKLILACLLAALCGAVALADRPVLVLVSPGYHSLLLQGVVSSLLDKGHVVVVAAGESTAQVAEDLSALRDSIVIIDHSQAPSSAYYSVLAIGYSWYQDIFITASIGASYPPYVETAKAVVGDALDRGATVGAAGAGVYLLPFSSRLASGTHLAAYDCPDLYGFIESFGYVPEIARVDPPPGSSQYGPDAELVTWESGDSWVTTLSVPDTWYDPDSDDQLWNHYGDSVERWVGEFSIRVPTSMESYVVSPWTTPSSFVTAEWATVHVYNPYPDEVKVTATYCDDPASDGCCDPTMLSTAVTTVPPMGFSTFQQGDGGYGGATTIESDQPVIAVVNQVQLPKASYSESYNGLPLGEPGTRWTIPSLETGRSWYESINVTNVGSSSADLEFQYVAGDGGVVTSTGVADPGAHTTFDPSADVGSPWQGAVIVTTDTPVIVTKTTTIPRIDGTSVHTSAAVAEDAPIWHLPTLCSETNAAGTSSCWVDVYNPNATSADVVVTVVREDGTPMQTVSMLPGAAAMRLPGDEISAANWCGSVAVASSKNLAVTATAQWKSSSGGTEAVEFQGCFAGVADGATKWVLPVPKTPHSLPDRTETQIVVQNVSTSTTDVILTFYPADGAQSELGISLDPLERWAMDSHATSLGTQGGAVVASSQEPILLGSITSWHDVLGTRKRPFGIFGGWKLSDEWYLTPIGTQE